MQRRFGCYVLQRLHLEVRCTHPGFDHAKWMLDGSAAQRDLIGIIVKTLLDALQDILVFPATDAALPAGRTSVLDHAGTQSFVQ